MQANKRMASSNYTREKTPKYTVECVKDKKGAVNW